MDERRAPAAFAALGQPNRLAVLSLLIRAGAEGVAAGDIAGALQVRPNTLSANLTILRHAGLIRAERQGRSVRYRADMDGVRALIAFLVEDCCGGRPELCQPMLDQIARP
ncbi:metalloregulator ArsR/SmtB family transcription factor [uncultured Paracoccus sp.]|uniref:ArsR/SmtB family transcription factor n=1 Tax=uncultured Paracoccus sp. TaxID=189685 RepID=UPI0026308DF6|nr:metalloregulator ArsR/SmtB family transcription factor [uncultured Paracoccus sp.]